jgi:diacylglycerol kinase
MKLFLKSFVYAAGGIKHCIMKERNFIVHCCLAAAVTIAGWLFHVSSIEWMIICINIGLVLGFEMFNSSIERLCDLMHPQHHPFVKIIKDVAAGAVLITAIVAAICGVIIFLPKIF